MESNPSKRRCVRERVRVTRACDSCKRKKLRCSGTLPCALCQRIGAACEFTAGYTRGRVPPIPTLQSASLQSTSLQSTSLQSTSLQSTSLQPTSLQPTSAPERHVEQRMEPPPGVDPDSHTIPHVNSDNHNGDKNANHHGDNNHHSNVPPSRNSPEPHQTDMEGHYVGPSSGVSFLIRVQKRLHEHVSFPPSITPIFSFGDTPLPKPDPSFLALPTREEAKMLLDRYFDFAFPTHRFLHQPRVEAWLDEFYDDFRQSQPPGPGAREVRALLLMLFAQAKQSMPGGEQDSAPSVNSALYFAASEHHLAAETGPVRLTSVQARLAQCFYLLSQSRINHCWSLFGTTARLAIAIGLHRSRRREPPGKGNIDHIEQECRKRLFWCIYSLDNYLSAALGRPRIFHDDDIDQELPIVANDAQITTEGITPPSSSSGAQSIMLAPVYHAKLSRIISGILRDLYGIRRMPLQAQATAAEKHGAELAVWRGELAGFLDLPNVDLLMMTYQRQYTVLNLAFYHAQILLYRPFILKNFAVLAGAPRPRGDALQQRIQRNIQHCLDASMKIAAIVRDLCRHGRLYYIFWFTHYYAFSAIVVLYVHFIQSCAQKAPGDPDTDPAYLEAGEQAQRDLATCGARSSFAQRYVMVLEELRREAQKWIHQTKDETAYRDPARGQSLLGASGNIPVADADEQGYPEPVDMQSLGIVDQGLSQVQPIGQGWIGDSEDTSPEAFLAGFTGWGEFDSLALTGLGELGYLFCD